MSASGSDIFFTTATQLVGQDQDELADLYDARLNRPGELAGFPAPHTALACLAPAPLGPAEECQLGPSEAPPFGAPGSLSFTGGANVVPGSANVVPGSGERPSSTTPSVGITAVKLRGSGLLVTVKVSQTGTVTASGSGLKSVRKILAAGIHQLEVALTSAGESVKRQRGATKLKVTLKVGSSTASATSTVRL